MSVIIKETAYVLAYVPDFVQYGSKPSRDIPENEGWLQDITDHLRSYEDAVNYAPHQVFIGNKHPDELNAVPKPWYEHLLQDGTRRGSFAALRSAPAPPGWSSGSRPSDCEASTTSWT